MSRRPGSEPEWRRTARAIEQAGRPLSSIELADALNLLPGLSRQRRQARVNRVMAEAAIHHAGFFVVAARGRSVYRSVPYNLWYITDAARQALAQPWPVVAKSTLEKQARRAALPGLAEARGWDSGTPMRERMAAAADLREMGHTLEDIARVFGVTRELIRIDLLPPDKWKRLREANMLRQREVGGWHARPAPKPAPPSTVARPRGRPLRILRQGMLKDLDTVTFTEW